MVYYQPKIHIGTRKTAAMEALIRWKKNDQLVRPDLFIPVAEESDLIDEICLFVMEEVCSFLKTLIEHGVAVPISVNISPHQLSYVTHSGEGEGLLFYGNVILPFADKYPKDTELYRIMTTKPTEALKE